MLVWAKSPTLLPFFIILVYPPFVSRNFFEISEKSLLVAYWLLKRVDKTILIFANVSVLAFVTSFSINGLSSLAFSVVVVIDSCLIKLIERFFNKANL